jgi:hypothetical protein
MQAIELQLDVNTAFSTPAATKGAAAGSSSSSCLRTALQVSKTAWNEETVARADPLAGSVLIVRAPYQMD